MLIQLWKGCKFLFESTAQQLNLSRYKNDGNRKSFDMAVEVWVDVLGFVRRIQLARTVSLTNRHIHNICWPRLHGNKVGAHVVLEMTIIEGFEWRRQAAKAILVTKGNQVPFPDCPVPDYITEFRQITINFLDNQVLDFITHISHRFTHEQMHLTLNSFDEIQRANVNQLVNILSRDGFPQTNLLVNCLLAKIGYVPNGGNKLKAINFYLSEESAIPNLIEFLAIPRSDGQQQVVRILPYPYPGEWQHQLAQKIMETIKQDFNHSTQSVPQPFYIHLFGANLNAHEEEENQQTNETLAITPIGNHTHICRHPAGQHEKLSLDAMIRLEGPPLFHNETNIAVNISEF